MRKTIRFARNNNGEVGSYSRFPNSGKLSERRWRSAQRLGSPSFSTFLLESSKSRINGTLASHGNVASGTFTHIDTSTMRQFSF